MSNPTLHLPVFFITEMLLPLLMILSFFAYPLIRAYGKNGQSLRVRKEKLDRAGAVTNVILGILYSPLSLVGSLFGMVGEGYINNSSPAQDVLIEVITILGFYTPLVSLGSILTSVLLRNRGCSRYSFVIQFAALVYFGILLALTALLDVL